MNLHIFLSLIGNLVRSPQFLLGVKALAIVLKLVLLGMLLKTRNSKTIAGLWSLAFLYLAFNFIGDAAWLFKLLHTISLVEFSPFISSNLMRLAWMCAVIEYLFLSFCIDSLISLRGNLKIGWRQITNIFLATCLVGIQTILWFQPNLIPSNQALIIFEAGTILLSLFFVTCSLIAGFFALRRSEMPTILARQFKSFATYIIIPQFCFEFGGLNFLSSEVFFLTATSTVITSFGFYLFAKAITRLRFLNTTSHIETPYDSNFIIEFKNTLGELAHVTTLSHMRHVTTTFFAQTLDIKPEDVNLFFRSSAPAIIHKTNNEPSTLLHDKIVIAVENLLSQHEMHEEIKNFLQNDKILIRDELEFTNFYEQNQLYTVLIDFLHEINADVFVPIFDSRVTIGYIVIAKKARGAKLYGSIERDKMLIYATYLGNIVNLFAHSNLQAMIKEQKDLTEELYQKHQEINQYKESIRSFLRFGDTRKIGIIFYKNRKFTFANQAASELITIDLNHEPGHQLTQACTRVAKQVEEFKSAQSITTKTDTGNKLVVSGIPSAQGTYAILTVYYPEITDTIVSKLEVLKDPSEWDYVLYLETTASGKLINQLIPGSSEVLLNFKIQLLKAALSRKALLLEMPQNDLLSTVEIIHHISLRSDLHILKLAASEKNYEVSMSLFGINPLFGASIDQIPLLEKLDKIGTLYINNVNLLSLESQQILAEYIRYGYFKPLKSDRKITSDVRVICSTNQDLKLLVHEGTFSADLYQVLSRTTLTFPSLVQLGKTELYELMDGYLEQAITTKEYKNLVEFNEREQKSVLEQKPMSLQDFKDHVHHLLRHKSSKKNISEVIFDPATTIADPELQSIIRLGKHALKDARMMGVLWKKFKNQTKIATLLGVNRSSVNRRCKEYNLVE